MVKLATHQPITQVSNEKRAPGCLGYIFLPSFRPRFNSVFSSLQLNLAAFGEEKFVEALVDNDSFAALFPYDRG